MNSTLDSGTNSAAIRDATADEGDALRDVFRRASLSNPGDRPLFVDHPEYLVWSPSPTLATRVAVVDGVTLTGPATAPSPSSSATTLA